MFIEIKQYFHRYKVCYYYFMSDNKNSYTYKRFVRNKNIFRFITLILLIYVLLLYLFYIKMLQATSFTVLGTLVSSAIFLIAFSFAKGWDKQNSSDFKWNYNTWGRGAGAELAILKALETLPQEYKTISDFNTGRGNIDFIIVGPKGIFTIECKAQKGTISYLNEKLFCNNKLIDRNPIGQTIAERNWLLQKLHIGLGQMYDITSLMEFPFGKPDETIRGPKDGIWIGGYKFHNYLIEKSRKYLSSEEITKIYNYLDSIKS